MKKKFFLKESDLRNLISNILEQVNDENQYYEISADEYKDKLETVNYRGDILTRLKIFKGKPLKIVGNLSLYGLPVSTLGNVARIEGNLDIGGTDIADISNIEITGNVRDYNSKRDKLRKAAELRKRREEANEKRQSGVWDGENLDETGRRANTLFKWLVRETEIEPLSDEEKEELNSLKNRLSELKQEYNLEGTAFEMAPIYDEIKELEEKIIELESQDADVYDIIPHKWSHWDLPTFEVLGLGDRLYTVATQDEMDDAVKEYADDFIHENGIEGFNQGFVESYIDRDYLKRYIYDFYYDDISQNPEIYFDDSDFESEEEQYPTDEMIEDKTDEYVKERMRDPLEFITEFGLNLEDFIDKDELAQAYIDSDGYGIMNSYNGDYDTIYFDGTKYYIMRVS